MAEGAERARLKEDDATEGIWRKWGAFMAERQWGTVREDYSPDGTAWDYLPHDHARSRAYRWGEDGLFGWCDEAGLFNFSIGLWNEHDPILKERLFGLTNSEGNHGEDVKELYYYLDGLPSGAYMKALYKYPISAFPYQELIDVNRNRTKCEPEYELIDTNSMQEGWFDVTVSYAKFDPYQTAIRVEVKNCGTAPANIHVLGQAWMTNNWAWNPNETIPRIELGQDGISIEIHDTRLGDHTLTAFSKPEWLFTENETNNERLFGCPNRTAYVKDGFHRFIVGGELGAVNPAKSGTKSAAAYALTLAPGETYALFFAIQPKGTPAISLDSVQSLFVLREAEANEFHDSVSPGLSRDLALIHRQCVAGLYWNKQLYRYDVQRWLDGDPGEPTPPESRKTGRNCHWRHFGSVEVLSMPDKWEYPWFAAWDLAFHTVAFALTDASFAKRQIRLLMREWYMHPNGQIPAYEWAFGDVNPPVHAWAAWRIYQIDRRLSGEGDRVFLKTIFHKLLLNFTWWVNRKDSEGNNVFEGGFLGLDNIGVFDRNMHLEAGTSLQQSDGTSWMGMFCVQMLKIALELAAYDCSYEDIAIKFFEHFMYISSAINGEGGMNDPLWNEEDGFYYDVLDCNGDRTFMKVRSVVGIIPLFAVTTLECSDWEKLPNFKRHVEWFLANKPELTKNVAYMEDCGTHERSLLSIVSQDQLRKILIKALDPNEFLSDYGIRALSKYHADHPYSITLGGTTFSVDYEPGESTTGSFGGNSNWRGPIWMPINYLLIESIQQFGYYYGDTLQLEFPTGSGKKLNLDRIAAELEKRLLSIYNFDKSGNRPVHNRVSQYSKNGPWSDLILFYEYFHGETGRGVGASHQTGWTAMIAKIINQLYVSHPES